MSKSKHEDWRRNLLTDWEGVRQLLVTTKRVAVLGIRTEVHSSRPAFYVPQYLVSAGLQVIPVPVYDVHKQEILGQKIFRDSWTSRAKSISWTCSAAPRTSLLISS